MNIETYGPKQTVANPNFFSLCIENPIDMTLFPLHGKAVVFNVPKVKCGLLNNKIKILKENKLIL